MTDLESKKLIVLKGILFLVILLGSIALIALRTQDWLVLGLLALVVWSAARFYYFLFYVLERYVDPRLKYAGLWALVTAIVRKRAKEPTAHDE